MTSLPIAIIGAGLSGSACAQVLAAAGCRVTVFEKSRGSGGRLASKRIDHRVVNLGAQSFRACSSEFRNRLNAWVQAGLLTQCGDDWWPTANTSQLTRELLRDVEFVTATRIETIVAAGRGAALLDAQQQRHGPFAAVIVSAPPLQAAPLVAGDPQLRRLCDAASLAPAWVAVFSAPREWRETTSLPESLARVVDQRESIRVDRDRHYWTVEASAQWSQAHLERDPSWIAGQLKALLQSPDIELLHCHRWRFARVAQALDLGCAWRAPLGMCGDWLRADNPQESGAEAAWRSGRELAQAVLASNLKPV
jgi:predicted NAD/FAD-dependent oxidoreductase